MYGGTAAATLRLRTMQSRRVNAASYTTPWGAAIPIVAIIVCVGIAAGATRPQFLGGLAALAVGAVMFLIAGRGRAADHG